MTVRKTNPFCFGDNTIRSASTSRKEIKRLERDMVMVMLNLEAIANALQENRLNEEAKIVKGHLRRLQSDVFRNELRDVIVQRNVTAQCIIDKVVEEFVSSFKTNFPSPDTSLN